ncbi:uncharacterized protein [Argopecten irradians]|uniref:uncharacterized protein n=1 Tax=Argopecten irradians TaxID=31199 RepID=UPI003724A919
METDSIRNEIEEIAEEMQGSIHRKKEEIIHPIETNADVFVKLLTERQEHIKERVSEFSLICEKIETLSNDGTVEYLRKTQRLVKKAKIALEEDESISLPEYQTFTFIKNQTVVEDLSKLELGDVVVPVLEERDAYYEVVTLPQPSGYACSNESTNHGYTNVQIHNDRDNPPPIPPRHELTQATSSDADNEYHYVKPLYDNTLKRENNERTIFLQQPTVATTKSAAISKAANAAANTIYRSLQPPPLPPFSGAFRNSISIASNNRIFPHKVIHRVYLQFRPLGFTVVRNKAAIYYAFVTTQDHSVQIFKQNGDFVRTISDLTKPFDIASQQHGDSPVNIYVTDAGRRTGDGCVRVYNSEGIFVKSLAGKLRKPRGIAVSRVGLVYVCDEANILVLCPDTGKKKRVISSIGKDPLFTVPLYVMVSTTGKILVSDVGTRQLKIHDETRKYTDIFQPSNKDEELYANFCPGMCSEDSSSNYYVVDQERNSLYMLGAGGKYEKMELPDKPIGHDGIPTAVTFDDNTGDIIVF